MKMIKNQFFGEGNDKSPLPDFVVGETTRMLAANFVLQKMRRVFLGSKFMFWVPQNPPAVETCSARLSLRDHKLIPLVSNFVM
jgi:hypothetical protein